MKSFPPYFMGRDTMPLLHWKILLGCIPQYLQESAEKNLLKYWIWQKDCKTKYVSEFMHYIRIEPVPLPIAQKTVVGLKKQQVEKNNEIMKKIYGPYYGWGSTTSRLEPLWGGSLLYNTKLPEIPGTHSIILGRMKDWVDLGATQWFWPWDFWIGNPAP